MKKIVILVIFLLSVSVGCNIKMDNLNPDELSIRQLQEDFLYIRDQIEKNHPALYLYYPQEIFNGFFDEAYASIDKPMMEAQFFRLLAPFVSKVKCCHTFIDFSDSYKEQERKAKLFPLGVTFLNGKAYIYQNYSHRTNITLGTRIISINGVPISTILMKLSDGISADGNITTSKYRKINRLFFQLYYELIDTPTILKSVV